MNDNREGSMANFSKKIFICLVIAVMACTASSVFNNAAAQDNNHGFSYVYGEMGVDYSSGDYGTGDDTDVFSIPLTVGYSPSPAWDLYLTLVPFLYQNTTNLVAVAGQPVRVMKSKTNPATGQTSEKTSHTGVGDTTAGITYYAVDETDTIPEVDLIATLKIPTADEDRGLGTGEFDSSIGVSMSKNQNDWSVYGILEYNFIGNPGGGIDLNNYASGTVGISRQCLPDFRNSLYVFMGGAISDESDDQLEIGLRSRLALDSDNDLTLHLTKGLWDGSPDYGLGLFWSHSF